MNTCTSARISPCQMRTWTRRVVAAEDGRARFLWGQTFRRGRGDYCLRSVRACGRASVEACTLASLWSHALAQNRRIYGQQEVKPFFLKRKRAAKYRFEGIWFYTRWCIFRSKTSDSSIFVNRLKSHSVPRATPGAEPPPPPPHPPVDVFFFPSAYNFISASLSSHKITSQPSLPPELCPSLGCQVDKLKEASTLHASKEKRWDLHRQHG